MISNCSSNPLGKLLTFAIPRNRFHILLILNMANKRMRKLMQNTRGQSRRDESNRQLGDEPESQDTISNSSLAVQNNAAESRGNEESNNECQRKRGKTVMKDVHALRSGDLLVVKFNERGQPCGEMQPTLANFVGTIARNGNVLPLGYLDWRKMPRSCLDDAWRRLTARFDIPNQHRNKVMQMMGVSWRRWKAEIKATSYDPNIPLDELVRVHPIPHDLTSEIWETLCRYWKTNERTSKINRENAHKKRGIHAQGRINIPSLEDKFFQENGRKPMRVELLELSRQSKKKGGAPVDDEAIRVETLVKEAVQRLLQDKPLGTQPTEVHEDAFRQVFGPEHSGRVRCLGAGALPSQVFPEHYKRRLIITQSNHPSSDVTDKFREMEEKMRDMEAQRHTELEQMRRKQENQLQNFARVLQTMILGASGGSRGSELLSTRMADMMVDIMQQCTNDPQSTDESDRSSPSTSDPDIN